jgi:hypothetical protein
VTYTIAQLQQLAQSVGFTGNAVSIAAAIAMAESGGNPNAYGDAQSGGSIGLWQINLPSHPTWTAQQLYNPTTNAQAAFSISAKGTNWAPWTTYNTGAYKKYYQPGLVTSQATSGVSVPAALTIAAFAVGGAYVAAKWIGKWA